MRPLSPQLLPPTTNGSPMAGDVEMWDDASDHTLSDDDVATPRGVDQDLVKAAASMSKACAPDCACRRPIPQWIHSRPLVAPQEIEPLAEPSADEIPWSDLVYWLGSEEQELAPTAADKVDCSCATGQARTHDEPQGHYLYIPVTFYSRLSHKIPVISLPRIEGIN